MKLYTWLPLLLTASASAKDAVCSNSLYGALAPLAQVPEAQGFCNSKFPPPKKRVAPSTTSTTSTTSSTTKSTTKSTTVSTTKSSTTKSTTLQASTTFKPSTTTKLGDKLSSLSALASDVAKTFCSCYFSAATTTTSKYTTRSTTSSTSISSTTSSTTTTTTTPTTTTTTTTTTTSSPPPVHTVDAPQCNPADNGDTGDCSDFCTCLIDNNGLVAYCGSLPEEPSCDVDEDCAQGSFCALNLAQCVQGTLPERCESTYVSGTKRSLFDVPMGRMSRRRLV